MPSAFLSYVREDSDAVMRIAKALEEFGVAIWLDKDSLKPGLRWQNQIRKGISEGDYFLACFSQAYAGRSKTYMNEELTLAIEELRMRPTDRAWFIPLKLDSCEIPDRSIGAGETLMSIQWVDMYTDWTAGMEKLLSVIVPASERIPRLIDQLNARSVWQRLDAIKALGNLGPLAKKAIPTMAGSIRLEDESPLLSPTPLEALREALRKMEVPEGEILKTITEVEMRERHRLSRWNQR